MRFEYLWNIGDGDDYLFYCTWKIAHAGNLAPDHQAYRNRYSDDCAVKLAKVFSKRQCDWPWCKLDRERYIGSIFHIPWSKCKQKPVASLCIQIAYTIYQLVISNYTGIFFLWYLPTPNDFDLSWRRSTTCKWVGESIMTGSWFLSFSTLIIWGVLEPCSFENHPLNDSWSFPSYKRSYTNLYSSVCPNWLQWNTRFRHFNDRVQ